MAEVAQIYLLDSNLHILFAQQRAEIKTFFSEIKALISSALHNHYIHIVPKSTIIFVVYKLLDSIGV